MFPPPKAALEQKRYSLVLLDVTLPHASGYAVSSWYREFCKTAKIRRAYVCAVTADPDIDSCKQFGIDRCLPKPLTSDTLAILARRWLEYQHNEPSESPSS